MAGGDAREWTPDDDADPAALFLAYTEASFWAMVWRKRVAKLDEPDFYNGSRNEAAENATARRLPMVNEAFDAGDWSTGADLLLPVGAPGWADYSGEPERLLAFRPDNCRGTAAAWNRLLDYRLEQLPEELGDIIRSGQERREQELAGIIQSGKEQAKARQQEMVEMQRRAQEEAERRYERALQEEANRKDEWERWQEFANWFNKKKSEGKPK